MNFDSGRCSILIVENYRDARVILLALISRKYPGLRLLNAEDGLAGLELFRENRPGIVITGLIMPCMDGIEMSKEILSLAPETAIVAMTAESSGDCLIKAMEAGIAHVMEKPIMIDDLLAIIDTAINRMQSSNN